MRKRENGDEIETREGANGKRAYVAGTGVRVAAIAKDYALLEDEPMIERISRIFTELSHDQIQAAIDYWREHRDQIDAEVEAEESPLHEKYHRNEAIEFRQSATGKTHAYLGRSRIRVTHLAQMYPLVLDELMVELIQRCWPTLSQAEIWAGMEYWRSHKEEIDREIADEEAFAATIPPPL